MTQSTFDQRLDTLANVNFESVNGWFPYYGRSVTTIDILVYSIGIDVITVALDSTNGQLTFTNDATSTNSVTLSMTNNSSVGGIIQRTNGTKSVAVSETVFFTDDFEVSVLQQLFYDGDTQKVEIKLDNGSVKSEGRIFLSYDGTEYNYDGKMRDI